MLAPRRAGSAGGRFHRAKGRLRATPPEHGEVSPATQWFLGAAVAYWKEIEAAPAALGAQEERHD